MCNLFESQLLRHLLFFFISVCLSLSLFYVALSVYVCSCRFVRFFYTHTFSLLIPSNFFFFSLSSHLFVHTRDMDTQWKREETFFLLYKKKYIDEETRSHYINSFNVIVFTFRHRFNEMMDWFDPVTHSFVSCRSMHHTGIILAAVNNRYVYDNGCEPWPIRCWLRTKAFFSLSPSCSPPVASYSTLIVVWSRLSDWGDEENKLVLVLPPSINK
jgi:hypothetical protein